jgi:hypothetical protein
MKQSAPMFSVERDSCGHLRIVITRPDGSEVTMPAHYSGRPEEIPSPPLASFLERNYPNSIG